MSAPFTATELVEAVRVSNDGPFPLKAAIGTARVLEKAVQPALDDLPPHHDCEVVRLALEAVFVMGIAAGVELERAR